MSDEQRDLNMQLVALSKEMAGQLKCKALETKESREYCAEWQKFCEAYEAREKKHDDD